MNRASWHAIVAAAAVVGAEFEGIKSETAQQLAAHTWVFWLCLVTAIIVGTGNSLISTKAPSENGTAISDNSPPLEPPKLP